jgi:hypothetical protein
VSFPGEALYEVPKKPAHARRVAKKTPTADAVGVFKWWRRGELNPLDLRGYRVKLWGIKPPETAVSSPIVHRIVH